MIRKHIRLLPAVIAMTGMLLAVKSVGFAIDARAADNSAQTQSEVQTPPPAETDPALDDSETASASEVDVLTSLSRRSAQLDTQAKDIANRQVLLDAAEKRVDGKIADLKALQSHIEVMLGERDAAAQKQLDPLVKTYSAMKPRDAARIFNTLDESVLLSVAGEMKPDVLGAVLAAMSPDAAEKLTVKLTNRTKNPATVAQAATTPPAPAPQQAGG
jgi:flagellar motility protein MotE (MotC chaperone)